jgi:hypothetical protein
MHGNYTRTLGNVNHDKVLCSVLHGDAGEGKHRAGRVLRYWREVATAYLKLDETRLARLISAEELLEVTHHAEDE